MSFSTPNFIVITILNATKHAINIDEIKTLTDAIPDTLPEGIGATMGMEITAIYMNDESCYLTSEKLEDLLARIKQQS